MTAKRSGGYKPSAPLSASGLCFGFFGLFCLLLILKNADVAITYMTRGLLLCARTVIPSLFPFMVISEWILASGIGALVCRPLSPLCRRLFRLSETGGCAVLLGMLCGFPVGAKCAVSALDSGIIDRNEAEKILNFSNNPSSAFLVSAVGVSLWGNRRFGWALYLAVLLSQILTGILFARLPRKSASLQAEPLNTPQASPHRRISMTVLTDSVRNAAFGMLIVCAYVVFFSALVGTLGMVLEEFKLPPVLKATVFCIFELSGGVSTASGLSSPTAAACLTAFAVGWSGISVHCQILSVCDGRGLHFRSYFLSKLLQSILCPLLLWCAILLFPSLLRPAEEAVSVTLSTAIPPSTILFLLALPTLRPRFKKQ